MLVGLCRCCTGRDKAGISPCNYLWCSDLESLFYTHILCVGEPVSLLHRAKYRWGPHLQLPVALVVYSHFFIDLSCVLVSLCCCRTGQDAGGDITYL